MKVQGNITQSVARICQDMYGMLQEYFYTEIDQLLEEFHGHWMGLVRTGIVQDVFAFEKVFSEFKRAKDLLSINDCISDYNVVYDIDVKRSR
jgi:hypothetical protein